MEAEQVVARGKKQAHVWWTPRMHLGPLSDQVESNWKGSHVKADTHALSKRTAASSPRAHAPHTDPTCPPQHPPLSENSYYVTHYCGAVSGSNELTRHGNPQFSRVQVIYVDLWLRWMPAPLVLFPWKRQPLWLTVPPLNQNGARC